MIVLKISAKHGAAVKVAGGIGNQAGTGDPTVVGVGTEGIQRRFRPGTIGVGRKFEDGTCSVVAALVGRAIQVPGCVENKAGVGVRPVGAAGEGVNNFFGPLAVGAGLQPVDHAVVELPLRALVP